MGIRFLIYLRNIWSYCLAKEAKRSDKAITSPPITAVNRALFRRQRATKNGASKCDNAKLVEPIHTAIKKCRVIMYQKIAEVET